MKNLFDFFQYRRRIQTANGLLHDGNQMVGHLGRSREYQCHLRLLLVVDHDIGDVGKSLAIGQRGAAKFQDTHSLLPV